MTLLVGTPIPEPLFTRIKHHQKWGVLRVRRCVECGFRWTTVEVALDPKWPECPCDVCPQLKKGHTKVKSHMHAEEYLRAYARAHLGRYPTVGEAGVYRYGGIWRRRECDGCRECGHLEKYHGAHKAFGKNVDKCAPLREGTKFYTWCGCEKFVPCLWKGKPSRWTTGEFSAYGVVTKDISMCPECGGRSWASQAKARGVAAVERQWIKRGKYSAVEVP